jgi:hypothetical protein
MKKALQVVVEAVEIFFDMLLVVQRRLTCTVQSVCGTKRVGIGAQSLGPKILVFLEMFFLGRELSGVNVGDGGGVFGFFWAGKNWTEW